MRRPLEEPRSIAFRREDGRLYAITMIGQSLFKNHVLVIARGSERAGVRRRTEEFVTEAQLASRWRQLVGLRRRHQYKEIPTS